MRKPRICFLFNSLISTIDLLIAGTIQSKQKNKIRSEGVSANKTYHFITDRYNLTLLENTKDSEVIIKPNGGNYHYRD